MYICMKIMTNFETAKFGYILCIYAIVMYMCMICVCTLPEYAHQYT